MKDIAWTSQTDIPGQEKKIIIVLLAGCYSNIISKPVIWRAIHGSYLFFSCLTNLFRRITYLPNINFIKKSHNPCEYQFNLRKTKFNIFLFLTIYSNYGNDILSFNNKGCDICISFNSSACFYA